MGFFYVIFLIALVTMVVFVIMSRNDPPTATQRELAQKMYGEPAKPQPSDDELLRDAALMMQKIEAMIQADEVGRVDVHQQINDGSYTGPLPKRRSDGGWTSIFDELRILSVAGINHRDGIVRYTGRNTVALVPEPKNEFDPQAIKVVAEDGHHLGYIRRDQTDMVRSWAADRFPMYCTCRIEEREDEVDGHRFYVGYIYLLKT